MITGPLYFQNGKFPTRNGQPVAVTAQDYANCCCIPCPPGEIPGCTDPTALNYNPEATCNDGSCQYHRPGCTDPKALNYDPEATVNDGSCIYPPPEIPGCTDPTALNYNPEATVNDGSCQYPPPPPDQVFGCTDPTALNFNPAATVNDGSCIYPPPPPCEPISGAAVDIHFHFGPENGHRCDRAMFDFYLNGIFVSFLNFNNAESGLTIWQGPFHIDLAAYGTDSCGVLVFTFVCKTPGGCHEGAAIDITANGYTVTYYLTTSATPIIPLRYLFAYAPPP